jgi:hypothetical protein
MFSVPVPLLQRSAKQRGLFQQAGSSLQHQLALSCSGASILVPFTPRFEHLYHYFRSSIGAPGSVQQVLSRN